MSKEQTEKKCEMNNEILKRVCEIENLFKDNFEAQANFLKAIVNEAMNFDKKIEIKNISEGSLKDPFTFILDFLGRGDDGRKAIAEQIMGKDWNKENKILFRGIQNLTRAKNAHLKIEVDKNCDENESLNIQECLKSIFCEDKDNKPCLKEKPELEKIKKIFDKPTATVTSVLYWLYPEQFIPFDSNTKELLKKLELSCDVKKIEIKDDWNCYDEVIAALRNLPKDEEKLFTNGDKFKPSMIIALSFAAWQFENPVNTVLDKYLDKKKPLNIILTGIPGTGKTYSIMEFLKQKEYEYEFVQFHPSYDYEDFIEGFKPVSSNSGQIEFKLVNGIFKDLCKKAFDSKQNNEQKTFVMVIDEINRANLSRVFGELLYCLEYRDKFVSTKMTTYIKELDEGKEKFSISTENENIGKFAIPDNVIILGTMNEVDRSIDAFDLALRRRFVWEDIGFDETALMLYKQFFEKKFQGNIEELIKKAKKLNEELSSKIGQNYQIGHTYFFKIADYFNGDFNSALSDLWEYHLKSIIREYCKVKFGEKELYEELGKYKDIITSENNRNGKN